MTHRSRLSVVVIDCRTEDFSEATAFWSGALGSARRIDARGKYTVFEDRGGLPRVLLQAVEHAPRVHLDLETDDQEAERARLEAPGATVVERCEHGWIVMEAPTGHRYCLVNPRGEDFPGEAAEWR
jgi:predicted enzyme related to lactoylglutathione lyase